MDKIEVLVMNPQTIRNAEDMMVCAARLTQRGHQIKDMQDFVDLYGRRHTNETVKAMANLPHPTIQKFAVINVAVVGASRRFLAQITRHQNEVKFMSASLQYSDYSGEADFVVPYELLDSKLRVGYISQCQEAMRKYKMLTEYNVNNDSAGYLAPQGLRNILIISATPYQWKHMISQRVCRRNTPETRYVILKIWEELYKLSPAMFDCGPFCMKGNCKEGKMTCRAPLKASFTPTDIIETDFPLLSKKDETPDKESTVVVDAQITFVLKGYREEDIRSVASSALAKELNLSLGADDVTVSNIKVFMREVANENKVN